MPDTGKLPPADSIRTALGFDFGERRIGVAVGQRVTGTASPLAVLDNPKRGKPDWAAIEKLLREWSPEALVVGIPLRDDGSEYPVTPLARKFMRQLHGRFGLPVRGVDERLSSAEAGTRLGNDHRGPVDHMAAAVILETWLQQLERECSAHE